MAQPYHDHASCSDVLAKLLIGIVEVNIGSGWRGRNNRTESKYSQSESPRTEGKGPGNDDLSWCLDKQ